jgi:hypothetical protein
MLRKGCAKRVEGKGAKTRRCTPQAKNLNRRNRRKQSGKSFAENAEFRR